MIDRKALLEEMIAQAALLLVEQEGETSNTDPGITMLFVAVKPSSPNEGVTIAMGEKNNMINMIANVVYKGDDLSKLMSMGMFAAAIRKQSDQEFFAPLKNTGEGRNN